MSGEKSIKIKMITGLNKWCPDWTLINREERRRMQIDKYEDNVLEIRTADMDVVG